MTFARNLRPHVDAELRRAEAAERRGDTALAFSHLERAHVLGQASTREHIRVHWRMLRWAVRHRALREFCGLLARIVGAATKTAIGLVPSGNTGGTNVSPFKRLPIPPDLEAAFRSARSGDRPQSPLG